MLVSGEASDEDEEAIGRWLEWGRVRRVVTGPKQEGPPPPPATSITLLALHWPQISELPFEASGLDGGAGLAW